MLSVLWWSLEFVAGCFRLVNGTPAIASLFFPVTPITCVYFYLRSWWTTQMVQRTWWSPRILCVCFSSPLFPTPACARTHAGWPWTAPRQRADDRRRWCVSDEMKEEEHNNVWFFFREENVCFFYYLFFTREKKGWHANRSTLMRDKHIFPLRLLRENKKKIEKERSKNRSFIIIRVVNMEMIRAPIISPLHNQIVSLSLFLVRFIIN